MKVGDYVRVHPANTRCNKHKEATRLCCAAHVNDHRIARISEVYPESGPDPDVKIVPLRGGKEEILSTDLLTLISPLELLALCAEDSFDSTN